MTSTPTFLFVLVLFVCLSMAKPQGTYDVKQAKKTNLPLSIPTRRVPFDPSFSSSSSYSPAFSYFYYCFNCETIGVPDETFVSPLLPSPLLPSSFFSHPPSLCLKNTKNNNNNRDVFTPNTCIPTNYTKREFFQVHLSIPSPFYFFFFTYITSSPFICFFFFFFLFFFSGSMLL